MKKLAQNKRKLRQRAKLREKRTGSPTAPNTSCCTTFRSRQSRRKALWKARRCFLLSPHKHLEVCSVLAWPLAGLTTTKRPRKGRRQADLDARIVGFHRSDPISRATSGKKYSRSFKLPDGSRERRYTTSLWTLVRRTQRSSKNWSLGWSWGSQSSSASGRQMCFMSGRSQRRCACAKSMQTWMGCSKGCL